ncbi:MAG TPA: indole-3-glycerol phosphate synthase TrpC [Kofleriaceae bacterium]|nr:indole-3-glycerol phosphate synthase TrpC [Kofleriaceae bacterium]
MSILERILATKRDELAVLDRGRITAAALAAPPPRPFRAALARRAGEPMRAIAEIKRASPSAGPIRPGADVAEIARDYASHGATAISVLTDRDYFDGDLAFLSRARAAVSTPLLRKDFVIDAIQIAEARAAGADAVLLIVAALRGEQLGRLAAVAADYGLDALVEIHDDRELDAALAIGATLIGVNHRDLATFTIDMELTARIAKRVPADIVLVAESGIRTADDVRRLRDAGAHAILVGESLMRQASPGAALEELLR